MADKGMITEVLQDMSGMCDEFDSYCQIIEDAAKIKRADLDVVTAVSGIRHNMKMTRIELDQIKTSVNAWKG